MPGKTRGRGHRGLTRRERQDLANGLLFISPWIVGFTAFMAYPIAMSLYYSLCDFSVLQPARYVGLANYRQLFADDVFRTSLGNTFIYAAGAIPLGILIAFSIAMLLNTGVPGMALFRTIYFLPSLVPAVALACLWLWIFNGKSGILNILLREAAGPAGLLAVVAACLLPPLLGSGIGGAVTDGPARPWARVAGVVLGLAVVAVLWRQGWLASVRHVQFEPPTWLSDVAWVKPALIFMSLWTVGHAVVIYLAGLQDVPQPLYEAADLDGADWWQKTLNVTIPMMSPIILFNGIMAIIGTFNYFAIPFVMTPDGQPARSAYFLAVNIYDNVFQFFRMGYASAMAWILFLIVFALTMLAMRLSERHVHYGS